MTRERDSTANPMQQGISLQELLAFAFKSLRWLKCRMNVFAKTEENIIATCCIQKSSQSFRFSNLRTISRQGIGFGKRFPHCKLVASQQFSPEKLCSFVNIIVVYKKKPVFYAFFSTANSSCSTVYFYVIVISVPGRRWSTQKLTHAPFIAHGIMTKRSPIKR